MRDRVQRYILESNEVKYKVYEQCIDSILEAAELLITAFKNGNKVLLCGNGGSAADCQHMATELLCKLTIERPGLPAIALTTDTSFITAYSNDYDYGGIFDRQIMAIGKPGDVLIAITTSGRSRNIMWAIAAATAYKGMRVISLTGENGFPEWEKVHSDVVIQVPSQNTQYIQESHLVIEHILCDLVEQAMFGEPTHKYGENACSEINQCVTCNVPYERHS